MGDLNDCTRILHAACMGAFACEGRCVANWAGLCAWWNRANFVGFLRVTPRLQPRGVCKVEPREEACCYPENVRSASAPWTWPPRNSVKVLIRVWFIPSIVTTSGLLLLLGRMLALANISQRVQLSVAKVHFYLFRLVRNVPFIFSLSSQHFWACQTRPDWYSSPNVWWMWVCYWWLRVAPPKPCGTLAWASGWHPKKFSK